MNPFPAFVLSLVAAVAVLGCGYSAHSGSNTIADPPPVQAATYSNSSITGTYGLSFSDIYGQNGRIGTFTADGNGNISSGSLTEYSFGGNCPETFTGTYAIQSDGSGTATLNIPVPCAGDHPSLQLSLQVTEQGQTAMFVESDQNGGSTGIASRK